MRIVILRFLWLLLFGLGLGLPLSLGLVGCKQSSETQTKAQPKLDEKQLADLQKQLPVLAEINDQTQNILLVYRDEKQNEQTAQKVSEVPEAFRNKVQLVDLNLSPEKRSSNLFVPIYDLTKANANGGFSGEWVSRKSLEKALIESRPKVVLPEYHLVTLYETDWCGYCKKAKAFLKEKKIPFEAFNIEKDAQAAQKLQQKASAQNFPMGGVPVLEINGKLISGFNPEQILSMAKIK